MDLEITKNLVISTGHISLEDNKLLEGTTTTRYEFPYGWIIYVSKVEEDDESLRKEGFSKAFMNLIKLARKNGCYYLILDCDGPKYSELPEFDW